MDHGESSRVAVDLAVQNSFRRAEALSREFHLICGAVEVLHRPKPAFSSISDRICLLCERVSVLAPANFGRNLASIKHQKCVAVEILSRFLSFPPSLFLSSPEATKIRLISFIRSPADANCRGPIIIIITLRTVQWNGSRKSVCIIITDVDMICIVAERIFARFSSARPANN